MKAPRSATAALGLPWILVLPLALSSATASAADWKQEQVTQLARELDSAVKALLADPGLEARQSSAMQQRRHHSAIVSVREFARRATELAQELARGRGRDQTRGLWEQMMLVRDDVRFYAEESSLSESVRAKAQSVRDLIDRIAPLYAGD